MSFVLTLSFILLIMGIRKDKAVRPTLLLLAAITLTMAAVSVCTLLHYHNNVIKGVSYGAVIGILPVMGSVAAVARWRVLRVTLFGASVQVACATVFLISALLPWLTNAAMVSAWLLVLPLGFWQYRRIRRSELDEITQEQEYLRNQDL